MKGLGLLSGAVSRWAAGVTWHLYKYQSSLFRASAVIYTCFFFFTVANVLRVNDVTVQRDRSNVNPSEKEPARI